VPSSVEKEILLRVRVPSKYTRNIPLVLYIYKTSYELLVSPCLAPYNIFDDSLYEEDTSSVKANNIWFTA
jgi:hypothetical protein